MHGRRRDLPRLDAFGDTDVGEGQALALRYIKVLRTFAPCDGRASIDIKVLTDLKPKQDLQDVQDGAGFSRYPRFTGFCFAARAGSGDPALQKRGHGPVGSRSPDRECQDWAIPTYRVGASIDIKVLTDFFSVFLLSIYRH